MSVEVMPDVLVCRHSTTLFAAVLPLPPAMRCKKELQGHAWLSGSQVVSLPTVQHLPYITQ